MTHTVLITGGTRGIGKACAERFLKNGYRVIAIYSSNDEAAELFAKEQKGNALEIIKCDVSDFASVKNTISSLIQKYNDIDILINNAGISEHRLLCDTTREEWDKMQNTNIGSVYNTVKCLYDHFVSRKWGRIINISSIWGITGASCEVSYSASKAAVIGFTKALAKELGPSGITVNCIAPGVIDTDMNSHLCAEDLSALCEETPLCRIGTPEEVASLAYYLASDDASFITGQVIAVDGGISI